MDKVLIFNTENVSILIAKLCDSLSEAFKLDEQLTRPEEAFNRFRALHDFEALISGLLEHLVGDFYYEPTKHKFEYERELLESDFLELAITHLAHLPGHLASLISRLFTHIWLRYVYRNRAPLLDHLASRGDRMLAHLLECLLNSSTAAPEASQILVLCLDSPVLARKIADLSVSDRPQSHLLYLAIIKQTPEVHDFPTLVAIFDFLSAFLLKHRTIQEYLFSRDNRNLEEHLTALLSDCLVKRSNEWLRITVLELFGDLIQNRSLLSHFVRPFTSKLSNFELFFNALIRWKEGENLQEEFVKLFEIFRLFFLNPDNETKGEAKEMKEFIKANFMKIKGLIDKAREIRSNVDVKSRKYEYRLVCERFYKLAGEREQKEGDENKVEGTSLRRLFSDL